MRRTTNVNHRKIKEEGGRKENNNSVWFSPFPFLYFSFCELYICVACSVFIYFQHVW
jgi:hypothetical protein